MATRREGYYLHTSLYAFSDAARNEVVKRFRAAIKDDTVKVNYFAPTETFTLQCPAELGAISDGSLRQIIGEYIITELDAAEKENRKPRVTRFPESTFDELGVFGAIQPAITPVERQSSSQVPRTQIVMTPENEGKLVKLFRLHDLESHGLLGRTLAQASARSRKTMSKGLVCRAARWSDTDGHVFNGRVDCHNTGRILLTGSGLHLPPFAKLHDRREGIEPVQEPLRGHDWGFVAGQEDTTVKQWLQGTGETRQEVPDTRSEIPKDARQYLASAQTHTAGRARVVKGRSMMPADELDEDASDSDDECDNFISLLHPKTNNTPLRIVERDTESEASKMSTESCRATFQELFSGSQVDDVAQLSITQSSILEPIHTKELSFQKEQARPQQIRAAVLETSSPASTALTRRSPPSATVSASNEWVDLSNEGYTKVDTMGLTANAKSTAKWQNENRLAVEGKKDKSRDANRLVFREPLRRILPPMEESGQESSGSQQSQGNATSSIRSVPGILQSRSESRTGADATWPHQTSFQHPSATAQLVNVDSTQHEAPSSCTGAVKIPPGFHMEPDRNTRRPTAQSATSATSNELEKLIDLIDEEHSVDPASRASKHPSEPPILALVPQKSGIVGRHGTAAAAQHARDDETIVEKVQSLPEGYAKRYNTMRQKAGYNLHSRKGKGKKIEHKYNVQLELPEPAPAPKSKERKQDSSSASKQAKQPGAQQESMGGTVQVAHSPNFKPSTRITRENHPFGKVLRSEMLKAELYVDEDDLASMRQAPKLVARIGLLLIRPDDKEQKVEFGAQNPIELQSALRETSLRTDFLPRLTTSATDAATILAIASPDESATISQNPRLVLEMIIRETNCGHLLKLVVPVDENGSDRARYSVVTRERALAEASCHYAVHVWDAQISLMQPGTDLDLGLTTTIDEFIGSMNSDGDPPSFRGQISKDACTIERVLAKRIYETQKSGIVFRLSEVQDLVLESLDLRDYNLRALSWSQEEMIRDQRYWWEALLETGDLSRADELQARVHDIVKHMDDVGLENKGPFVVCNDYQSDVPEEIEQPFW